MRIIRYIGNAVKFFFRNQQLSRHFKNRSLVKFLGYKWLWKVHFLSLLKATVEHLYKPPYKVSWNNDIEYDQYSQNDLEVGPLLQILILLKISKTAMSDLPCFDRFDTNS